RPLTAYSASYVGQSSARAGDERSAAVAARTRCGARRNIERIWLHARCLAYAPADVALALRRARAVQLLQEVADGPRGRDPRRARGRLAQVERLAREMR